MAPIIIFLGKRVHKLEFDPVVQFKFNFFFTWFWFLSLIIIPCFPKLYGHNIAFLITIWISLWALFISHFTALGAAIAGIFASNRQSEIAGLEEIYKQRVNVFDEADAQELVNELAPQIAEF